MYLSGLSYVPTEETTGAKRFSRKVEDFTCSKCGATVKGAGFTDHCPHCLWSKHVDINPGDRRSKCHGLMRPIKIVYDRQNYIIYYRCMKCALARHITAAPEDYDAVQEWLSENQQIKT
ncbi:MAG: RNHCP domain-containing protein [Candidatus Micrarchaeota archaeon]|nr:RNHCP domain-containing protein [Candidatus Micrarchaeota archaeon]